MKMNGNMLRRSAVTLLCSLALLVVCGGLAPITVQADELHPAVYIGSMTEPLTDGAYTNTDCGDITSGTVIWDSSSNTLTLDNATIRCDDERYAAIAAYDRNLTIVLERTNQIESSYVGIFLDNGDLLIRGGESLEVSVNGLYDDDDREWYGCGIYSQGALTISDIATLDVEATNPIDAMKASDITIEGSKVLAYSAKASAIGVDNNLTITDSSVYAEDIGDYRIDSNGDDTDIYAGTGIYGGVGTITIQDGSYVRAKGRYAGICLRHALKVVDSDVVARGLNNNNGEYNPYGPGIRLLGQDGRVTSVDVSGASGLTVFGEFQKEGDFAGFTATPMDGRTVKVEIGADQHGIRRQPYTYVDEESNTLTSPFDSPVTVPYEDLRVYVGGEDDDREDPANWWAARTLLIYDSKAAVDGNDDSDASMQTDGLAAKKDVSSPCNHQYAWETYKAATATSDGVMRYRCVKCGTVEYEVPTAAYYTFNKDAQEAIQQAAQGATVTVETPVFVSFHEMVKDALAARPDVTLVVDYKYQGKRYEMTIPAGGGETLNQLFGDSRYAGFRYLGDAFTTVDK